MPHPTSGQIDPTTHVPGLRGPALLLLAVALFAAQVLLYHQSFQVQPASDDFAFTVEIQRGITQGCKPFFTHSLMDRNYRPLKSLVFWWFGSISAEHREFWIRVLNFLS